MMLGKLPFSAGIFWRTFIVVGILVVLAWVIAVKAFGYTMTPADYVGTVISGILLVYLVHLWILPAEQLHRRSDNESTSSDSSVDHEAG